MTNPDDAKPRPDRRAPIARALEPLEGRVALSDVGDLVVETTNATRPPPLDLVVPVNPLAQIEISDR